MDSSVFLTHHDPKDLGLISVFSKEKQNPFSDCFGFKDVRAKIFQSIDCSLTFYCSQVMSYLCQNCNKKLAVTDFVSEIKRVENYPDF